MRILYLADRISTRGGADLHLLDVIHWAAARGFDVAVAAGRTEPGVALPDGVRVSMLRGLGARDPHARLNGLDDLLAGANIVHVQNVMNPVALARATAAGRTVVTVQDHRVFCPGPGRTLPDGNSCGRSMSMEACAECLPDHAYRRHLLAVTAERRDALAAAASLIVLSRYMARELEAAGLPGAEVLPPWVQPGAPRARAGDTVLLGGRLVRHKAVVEAWKAWQTSACGLRLRVAGSGPQAHHLLGAEPLGWLPREELRRELRGARALLFPAGWQEPFGILGVEALAEGTPVVVADSGGTCDWSDRGCLRVAPGDVAAMAEGLLRLVRDPSLALSLGRDGQAAVAERFAPAPLQARLETLYASVSQGATPPAGR
ncbi:MAG: glycosyltransferase family 4 protein [Vicinamibacterales bacterium]